MKFFFAVLCFKFSVCVIGIGKKKSICHLSDMIHKNKNNKNQQQKVNRLTLRYEISTGDIQFKQKPVRVLHFNVIYSAFLFFSFLFYSIFCCFIIERGHWNYVRLIEFLVEKKLFLCAFPSIFLVCFFVSANILLHIFTKRILAYIYWT